MIETGYEKILGIPSMQSILEFLSVYNRLSIKDLKLFTGFSARTIHDNLKLLKDHDMIIQNKRGVYELSNSRVVQLLAKFYEQIVIEQIGNRLQEITAKIDDKRTNENLEADLNILEKMYEHWKPVFDKYFPSAIQTILLSSKK
ncbi:MAG: hypothetical protein ACTSRW_01625 [Candidatus Helarchaeota archaeon]